MLSAWAYVTFLFLSQPAINSEQADKTGLKIESLSVFGPISEQRKLIRIDPIVNALVKEIPLQTLAFKTVEPANKLENSPALASGYAWFKVKSPKNQVVMMTALGAGMFYVNGEPHAGDPYAYNQFYLPIQLKAGTNDVLAQSGFGGVELKWKAPTAKMEISLDDSTLPSVGSHLAAPGPAGIVVKNTVNKTLISSINYVDNTGKKSQISIKIQALSVSKIVVPLGAKTTWFELSGSLAGTKGTRFELPNVTVGESYLVTFKSNFDDSVQTYGVRPSIQKPNGNHGLVLSVHGASVAPMNQANAYANHEDLTIICPTNRRPYGFNWEDLGRRDGLEVLEHSKKLFPHDPKRIYLTGHSMGGHGTWHIGGQHPGMFAAIVPCAGWETFQTYTGGPNYSSEAIDQTLKRAALASDVPAFVQNYSSLSGIYIIHGEADKTVPVSEARSMYQKVRDIVPTTLHEEKDQDHWYDTDPSPGANCVDFAPAFELFKTARLKDANDVKLVNFVTADLGIHSELYWVKLHSQINTMTLTKFNAEYSEDKMECKVENLGVFELLNFSGPRTLRTVRINEQTISVDQSKPNVYVRNTAGIWAQSSTGNFEKPMLHGFKAVWDCQMAFIIGSTGTKEEIRWMLAKARYDSEMSWYRGNATPEIITDVELSLQKDKKRNFIVYGSESSNGAFANIATTFSKQSNDWKTKLRKPNSVFLGICKFGTQQIGFIGGSDLQSMKASERLPVFGPGVGVPDLIIANPDIWIAGNGAVREARFWNPNWTELEK